jgi:hypothetical protein
MTSFSFSFSDEMISDSSIEDFLPPKPMTKNLLSYRSPCPLFPTSYSEMSNINSLLEVVKTNDSSKAVPYEGSIADIDTTTIENYSVDRFYKHIVVEVPTVCTKCGMQQELTLLDSDTIWKCKECNGKLLQLDDEIVLADKDWEDLYNDDIRREEAGSGENAFDVLGVKVAEQFSRLGLVELQCEHHKGLLVPASLGNKDYAKSQIPKMIDSILDERDSILESKNIWNPHEAETVFNKKTGTSAPARFARSFPMNEAGEKNYDQQESLQYVPKLTTAYYINVPWSEEQIETYDELLRQQEVAKSHMLKNKFNALPLAYRDENDNLIPVETMYMTTPENCGDKPPQTAVINKHFVKTGIIKAVHYKDMTYQQATKVLKNYFWAKKNGRQDIVNESIRTIRQACNHEPPTKAQMTSDSIAINNDVLYVVKEGINGQTSTVVPTKEPTSRYLIDGKVPSFEQRMIKRIETMMRQTNSDWKRGKLQKRIDKIKSGMVTEAVSSPLSINQNSNIPDNWITNGMENYKLAIVGSSRAGTEVEERIKSLITDYVTLYGQKLVIVSGGASGVDSIAEKIAKELGVATETYLPKTANKEGYRDRNQQIAENSNEVISIALPTTSTRCYHCDEDHERTGGCWCKNMAKEKGRIGRTVVVGLV